MFLIRDMGKIFMKLRRVSVLLCWMFVLSSFYCYPQNDNLAIGQWRVHLPFNKLHSVADGNDNVYCASTDGIFAYSKSEGSITRITRLEGLSDFDITRIRYNKAYNILVVVYQNSNIDLIYSDNSIYNISDIFRASIIGNKTINHINFDGRYCYLSCGFGIVVLDLVRREVKDTYYIGPNGNQVIVNGTVVYGGEIFAATHSGIYRADVNNPLLSLYTSWTKDTTLPLPNNPYYFIAPYGNKLVAETDSTSGSSIVEFDGNVWGYFNLLDHSPVSRLEYSGNHLTIVNGYSISCYNTSGSRTHYIDVNAFPNSAPQDGFVDSQNILWIADARNGLVRSIDYSNNNSIYPNGPYSKYVFSMASSESRLWVAGGLINGNLFINAYSKDGAYLFKDNQWRTYNKGTCQFMDTCNYFDFVSVAIDPNNPDHVFFASWGSGLFELTADGCLQNIYNESNSTLVSFSNSYNIRVGGLSFDTEGNLWMTNSTSTFPISVKRANGTWNTYAPPAMLNFTPQGIMCDSRNRKWIILPWIGGLVVFDEANFFSHTSDEVNDPHARRFSTPEGKGKLPSLNVQCIAEDLDGQIWIGTEEGVAVLYSPDNVYSGNFDFQQILIQQDGNYQYLLETETVTSIAIDGANRKWFGTLSGGVFLMSADGTQQILHFTTDNSPLLSNYIFSIAIDQKTGEVFFGTEKGIVSYKGDAIEGGEEFDNVYVYPNPVRPDYRGSIAIRGLVANANVKITDISGNIVYETKANGGLAVWNGNNFKGERAQSGVYLVFCADDDGQKTHVTKLLLMH
jgi:hypothetical protein